MSAPTIPESFNLYPQMSGSMGVDATHAGTISSILSGTVNQNLSGTVATNVNAVLTGDPSKPIATLVIGDPSKPIGTDSKIELLNLPKFTLQDIKDMMKVRARIPNYSQVCFKVFGQEIFSICMNGEAQVITEPYVPNAMERCEVDCCEPDTRPFPERSTDNNNDNNNNDNNPTGIVVEGETN